MDSTEKTKRASRRKACESCRVRKRKCDGKRPTCSHCLIYGSDCIWGEDVQSPRPESSSKCHSQTETDRLRSRLSQVEAQLKLVQAQVDELTGGWPSAAKQKGSQQLAQLSEISPLIDDYFATQNTVIPLFDRESFMQTVHAWYESPAEHGVGVWASINVVLAMALQRAEHGKLGDDFLQQCIEGGQSAVGSLIAQDLGLQGIQAVLGLVLLSLGALDLRPTAVLAAVAVQLAFRLRLHMRRGYSPLDPEQSRMASRVFWITYTLDREIAIRTGDPYLLKEGSFDVDPPDGSYDWCGHSHELIDGSDPAFDWFSCRISLANIQGRINDLVVSHQATKSPEVARMANIELLDDMLQHWLASIPEECHPQALAAAGQHTAARHSLLLFASYYFSLFVAHGVLLHNDTWMDQLTAYSNRYVIAYHGSAGGMPQLPFPVNWSCLLQAARDCMAMFRLVHRSDKALLGAMRCAYVSGFIIMVAGGLDVSRGRSVDSILDDQLQKEGLHFLGRIYDETRDERFKRLYFACSGLIFRIRDWHCSHEPDQQQGSF